MNLQISSGLLQAIVLAAAEKEPTYGYKITHEITEKIEISESTLYPVLRKLEKNGNLESYNQEYMGRNRKYYSITDNGRELLERYRKAWDKYKSEIDLALQRTETKNSDKGECIDNDTE